MNFLCGYFAWYSLILYTSPKELYVPYLSALFRLEAILNFLCTLLPHNRVLLKMVGTCKPAWRETSDVGGYRVQQSWGPLQIATDIHLKHIKTRRK